MRLNDAVFRVIDSETVGLEIPKEPGATGVCEVAYADISADGRLLRRWSGLFDPGVPIPPQASAVHHLTDDDVRGCASWASVSASHAARLYVAHNAPFDRSFLRMPEPALWICTHRWAKHLWPELPSHGNEGVRYGLKLEVDSVKDAASHRAVNDVMVTVAILKRALSETRDRWKEVETVEQLIARIAKPVLLRTVPFKSANGVTFENAETSLLQWIISRGAGGEDCVHSANHWLRERFGGGQRSLGEEDEDVPF